MDSGEAYRKLRKEIPPRVTLVAVSKGFSWAEVEPAYRAGCRDFGESRLQEALDKQAAAPDDVRWHFIGTLQSNKVRKAIGKFVLIHSIDSLELAKKVSQCSLEMKIVTPVLLQVNVSAELTKHGLAIEELFSAFNQFAVLEGIRIDGLMTIAPNTNEEQVVRLCFNKLRHLRDELRTSSGLELPHLSMGMSLDYPIALKEGATLVRIGSALFGQRDMDNG